MTETKMYYEQYWARDSDVSERDVTTPERKKRLLQTLEKYCKRGDQILDLGCGWGKFTAWIKQADYEADGLDICSKAVEIAQRSHPSGSYETLHQDGSIPAPDGHYSAVWCTEVIEHILDIKFFFNEINRVLKPNGLLILTTPYHGIMKNLLIVLHKLDRHFNPEGSHIRYFDKRGLERCLNNSGFAPISWSGIGRFWKMYRTWFVVARKSRA